MVIGIDASRAYISDRTGTENYSYHLINAILRLPEAKLHTFVLFTRPNAILPQELDGYDNVIIKTVKFRYLWTQLGLAWETYQKFEIRNLKFELDVLWVPAHTLPLLRRGFGGLGDKLRTVVTIHGLEYQWLPEYKNLLQRWYLPLSTIYATKQADRLIAVSNFTAHQLKKELHTSAKKITVIHEGVEIGSRIEDLGSSKQTLLRYGLQDKKYILFVGTIQPRKNLVSLIQAFADFSLKNPEYKLVIAGRTGWMASSVFKAPSRYNIQEKVVFTGRVSESELQGLYDHARIYVQPSITEGFGLPVLEAMRAGVPVVSSDGGALREIVGEAGVVVKLNHDFIKELSLAINRLVRDQKQQKSLITMGFKRINELSWDKAGRATLKVLVG